MSSENINPSMRKKYPVVVSVRVREQDRDLVLQAAELLDLPVATFMRHCTIKCANEIVQQSGKTAHQSQGA